VTLHSLYYQSTKEVGVEENSMLYNNEDGKERSKEKEREKNTN
jgi:hypothetical protein